MAYLTGNISKRVISPFRTVPGVVTNAAVGSKAEMGPLPLIQVSAVLITYNEEAIIEETLSKLWWCDEIVIIDSGSTDRTTEICQQFGCSIFQRSFVGFGDQKKFGISKATNDWVLCLDADEILTDGLINEIIEEISQKNIDFAGFAFPRNLVFMGKVFQHGKEAGDHIIRMFDRKKGNWDGACVHEKVMLNGKIKKLQNKLLHYSYQDYGQFLYKINLYSTLGASKLESTKTDKNKLVVALGLPFNFFKYFIIDRNFLNGYKGFAWSVLNSIYHFVKYLKLSEKKVSRHRCP